MTRTKTAEIRPSISGKSRMLRDLLVDVSDVAASPRDAATPIRGIRADSTAVAEGDLFVAIRGDSTDGHEFLLDAVRRGARALMVETEPAVDVSVPVIRVRDGRRALAELAAAWYGHPARDLHLVGISGTVGKTSVLALLEAILAKGGTRMGSIGSLGVHLEGETLGETGYTAPDALLLHENLAELRATGCDVVGMEVTSHALAQKRVHGLTFDLGIFTNLLPLEHQEYHGSFEQYVKEKVRFFDHLAGGAPLVFTADDPAVTEIVETVDAHRIACGVGMGVDVRIGDVRMDPAGTTLSLFIQRALPGWRGEIRAPLRIECGLRLLGRSHVRNVALAATAGLILGAEPDSIRRALADFPPPRRRVEMIHRGRFMVLDDTVGHPESVNALFEAVMALRPRRLHIAFAIRGTRGPEINHHTAEALAIWAERLPPSTLVVTRSSEAADERNRVSEDERSAFLAPLTDAGISYEEADRLDEAVRLALEAAGDDDLVLLLGAQGMDAGAEIARDWLATRDEPLR